MPRWHGSTLGRLKTTRFFLLACQARRMNEMRIQNTTNSIANAICRSRVQGLSLSRIYSCLQRQSRHLPLGRLALLSWREVSGAISHLMGMLRNLTMTAARFASDMDANLERCLQAFRFAMSPSAVPVGKPATLEARTGKPGSGFSGNGFRKQSQIR